MITGAKVEFETVPTNNAITLFRAEVPGGWLVMGVNEVYTNALESGLFGKGFEWRSSLCFVPDPEHHWLNVPKCRFY